MVQKAGVVPGGAEGEGEAVLAGEGAVDRALVLGAVLVTVDGVVRDGAGVSWPHSQLSSQLLVLYNFAFITNIEFEKSFFIW